MSFGRARSGLGVGSEDGAPGSGHRVWGYGRGLRSESCVSVLLFEDFVFGDAEAAEFEAEFRGFEALGVHGVGEAAAGEQRVAVGDRDGTPGEGLQGLREEIDDGVFVFEEGDVDGALGAAVDVTVMAEAVVLAAEGPVAAALAVGFGVVALAVGGGEAAGVGF
jgi:hypothetical protein